MPRARSELVHKFGGNRERRRMEPDPLESIGGKELASFEQESINPPPDISMGAAVGSLMGATVGWTCCWLAGENDYFWHGAIVGAIIGLIGGVDLGLKHRKGRTNLVSSEIGTKVCIIYALLPAILVLVGATGIVRGKFSGLAVLAGAFTFPMAGLLIGGIVDRVYEGFLRRRKTGSCMRISPEYLPTELHYIIPLAERHGSDSRIAKFNKRLGRHVKYAETLSAKDLQPLRQLYNEISSRGHSPLINSWHDDHSCKGTCPPETTWPIYGLLCLFAQLGSLGIAPFNDGAVCPQEVKQTAPLDWSKLPPSLRYLAGPAEVYGGLQFDDPIYEFLQKRMTADERAELDALSKRYGQDWEAISRWLDEYPMTDHPEARLVYFTGHLLGTGADLGLL